MSNFNISSLGNAAASALGFNKKASLEQSLMDEKGTPTTTPPDSPKSTHSFKSVEEGSTTAYQQMKEAPSFTGVNNDAIAEVKAEIKLNDLREPLLGSKATKYSNLSPGHTVSNNENEGGDYHLAEGDNLPKPGYLPPTQADKKIGK